MQPKDCPAIVAACFLVAATARIAVAQHITIDGRFSPAQTLVGPNYWIGANLGKQVGSNLFHSFGQFSLSNTPVPESATFISTGSTAPISNVIGRVTGGSLSSIDGKIQSNIAGANLYLINPNGVVFGPNATVNVAGSLHASTADYIKMSDGARFQATNPGGSILSSAPPAAFGFLNTTPGSIAVNGSVMRVPQGQTLGLIGGPVSIAATSPTARPGARLSAPGGTIRVASVVGPGEVPAVKGTKNKPTVNGFGPVDITQGSILDVSSGGSVFIRSGTLVIEGGSQVNANNFGSGSGGRLVLHADRNITLSDSASVQANVDGSRKGGAVSVKSGRLSISSMSEISSTTSGRGPGGDISVNVAGALDLDDGGKIQTASTAQSTGNPGNITIHAGSVSLTNRAEISSLTFGPAKPGYVFVNTGNLDLRNSSDIQSSTQGPETAGDVTVNAANASISNVGEIHAGTKGTGNAGNVYVSISGNLAIDGPGGTTTSNSDTISFITGIGTVTQDSTGNAGNVFVSAGSLSITGILGEISSSTLSSGAAGKVSVDVAGHLSIAGSSGSVPTGIVAAAFAPGSGNAGDVAVRAGSLSIINRGEISATSAGSGVGGSVTVTTPGPLLLTSGALIAASALATQSGQGGSVTVDAGSLTVQGGAQIASSTAGPGKGGNVTVRAANGVILSGAGPAGASGITTSTELGSSGDAGQVVLQAGGAIALSGGAEVVSSTAGAGKGGSVSVTTPGTLVLDGMGVGGTRIAASADQGSLGEAGDVTVGAGNLTVQDGAQIASSTAGPGKGGDVGVKVASKVNLSGVAADGTASGISAAATQGSVGGAGQVILTAGGALSVSDGAEISSSTAGQGDGGRVTVNSQGPLSLSGGGSIVALATPTASGNAGSVTVAANALTVEGGAQIASSTAGPGKGGDVNVVVAGDITLPDRGPQITAQSTGSGDAGSITVSAARVLMSDGGKISTEAETLTANGGNITLNVRDLLYLVSSKISTSVKGETGNGGNITIDPQFVVLNHSSIIAEAVEGHGGNITINADQFIPSADSIVSASSQLGISGTVVISGPRVDVNGALVVLSTELRNAAEVLRHSCAAQAAQPQSSLVEGGRGGLPQDPDTTLPALYIAGRDVDLNPEPARNTTKTSGVVQTTAHLTMHCG